MKGRSWRLPKAGWGRKQWAIIVALAGIAWLVSYLHRHQPIARLALPDGTELRLEYVTYGTEHRIPGAGRIKAWLSRQAQRWPSLNVPEYEAEYTRQYREPQLCLWFTHFDPKAGKFLPDVDKNLIVERADSYGTFINEFNPSGSGVLPWEMDTLPMPRAIYYGMIYDRRKPNLQLRVTKEGQSAFFSFSNPAANSSFPAWEPKPLPQTQRVGELEIVLQSFVALRDGLSHQKVRAELEVFHQGRKAEGIFYLRDIRLSDATGNAGDEYNPLPESEPAWKVRRMIRRSGDYPFARTEGVVFDALVPPPGECQLLKVPDAERAKGFRLGALLGPGSYAVQHDAILWNGPAMTPEEFATAIAIEKRPDTLLINTTTPVVAFVFTEVFDKKWNTSNGGYTSVRMTCAGKGYGIDRNGAWLKAAETHTTFASDELPSVDVYALATLEAPAPPPGTPVTIQIVAVPAETVEFIVAPPKPPENILQPQ